LTTTGGLLTVRVHTTSTIKMRQVIYSLASHRKDGVMGSVSPLPPLPGKLTPLHPDHFFHQGA